MIIPHMYYMSSPFYHSFAMLNHTFSYHLHTMSIIHGILFIMHHCTHVETVTPEQEQLEPEIIGDSTPVERSLETLLPSRLKAGP